ncbi:MAG: tetratricopeptide repeat protein [Planctomycetes bacterium]|nr:tetratricopeptide repeat protein [Planctomycetota bacterium]
MQNVVFDVTARDFERDVVVRSRDVPVLLDFWADWCGPCRALGPVLEKLAGEFGGGFVLGKIDTEREQELAMAFRVQSIPFCVLFDGGQPVDAFAGALPESEVRRFLERNGVRAVAGEAAPEPAPADPDGPVARLRAGLAAVLRGDCATARERLDGIPEEEPERARARRLLDGLQIWEQPPTGEAAGKPAGVALLAGRERLAGGDLDGAVEAFLDSMQSDKAFAGELARRAAVMTLELMGLEPDGDDRASAFRRRMATLMY